MFGEQIIFAYIFGNLFGSKKLGSKLSPNKTIEGSLGGILGSLILSIILLNILNQGQWKIIVLSNLASIMAQLGDLTASRIKRITGIKDYGYIMPGHGGILDRFDSIIFYCTNSILLCKIFYIVDGWCIN